MHGSPPAGYTRLERTLRWSVAVLLGALAVYARWPTVPQPFLWNDEAWRAWSVASTGGLLDFIAYMSRNDEVLQLSEWVLAKASWLLFGSHPFGFRIWPLLFSLAALAGVFAFMGKVGQPELAAWPALAVAVAFTFVHHGREFKPYALDLALTLWTLWATLHAVQDQRWKPLWALLSVLALSSLVFLFIYPAVLLFCAMRARRDTLARFTGFAVPPALFLLTYLLFLKPQSPAGTSAFWAANYLTSVDSTRALAARIPDYLRGISLHGWLPLALPYLLLLPALTLRRTNGLALLLLTPLAVQILAAVFRIYPLFDRPSYYLYGIMTVGAAVAAGEVMDRIARTPRRARLAKIAVVLLALLVPSLDGSLKRHLGAAHTWPPDTGRLAMQILRNEFRAGDQLVLNKTSYYTFLFHRPSVFPEGHPLHDWTPPARRDLPDDPDRAAIEQTVHDRARTFPATPRLWFMNAFFPDTHQHYVAALTPYGTPIARVSQTYQSLVEFTPSPHSTK